MKKLARWFFAFMYKKEISKLNAMIDISSGRDYHYKKIGIITALSYLELMEWQ